MPFYGQNGQRNDGLYFVMTSSSWTLIVLAYQMKNPLTGQSAAHRARYETDMVGSSVTAVHFLFFRCLQSIAGFFQGGMLFPCHVVLQQTGTLCLLSFPKQHEVQMDFTAAESFSGSRLLFFIGKW